MIFQRHVARASWELAPAQPGGARSSSPGRVHTGLWLGKGAVQREERGRTSTAVKCAQVIHQQGTACTQGLGNSTNPKNKFTTSQKGTHDFLFFFFLVKKKKYRKLLKGLAKPKDGQNIAELLKTITRAKGHAALGGSETK